MPEPIGRGQRYMPGLDGVRAIAVLAVVADHLGLSWAPGGLLGVGIFFTLSGYLITDLLLGEWRASGRLRLGDFWMRRARRLLPALFVMLAVVGVWVAIAEPSQAGALRGELAAAALYVSNWWAIFHHLSYFARFGPPSPLGHLWSLAVEEQFYLVWPLLLWLGLSWTPKRWRNGSVSDGQRRPRRRWPLVGVTVALAAASATEMAVLYHPSFDPTRIYDGTDTRAFALLVGAALAMVWPSRGLRADVTPGARRLIDGVGTVGLVTIALLIWRTNEYSPFLYRGGMALLSVASVLVVAVASHPASRVAKALGWRPLRWIGVRSYAIYLWHFPIIVLTTPTVTKGVDLVRVALQVGASFGLAALSWRFIESPIRHGALGRAWAWVRSLRSPGRARGFIPAKAWLALSAGLLGSTVGFVGFSGVAPSAPAGILASPKTVKTASSAAAILASPKTVSWAAAGSRRHHFDSVFKHLESVSRPTGRPAQLPRARVVALVARGGFHRSIPIERRTSLMPLATSCTSVVHIGDSTSESLISPDYLPDPAQRLGAQYRDVGVTSTIMEIEGATSVVETLPGGENAYDVASGLVRQGYRGCWVIALGTNDAADVYVGSNVSLATRIQRMMSVIGDQPVMWVTAKSLLDSGPYSDANMELWNQALINACSRYPNMRVFNWAAMAQPGWFISDGIHYSSAGSAVRAAAIAHALARAFPQSEGGGSASSSCVVS